MAEIRTVTTLRSKRDEIAAAIANYEKRLAQARADLSHVNACITIFEASGERDVMPPYVDVHRIFARNEAINLCKEALASGPMNTRQLAQHVMKAKGLDAGDKVLGKAVASRLIHALRQQVRRGGLAEDPAQVHITEHDHMVETFPSDRTDKSLNVRPYVRLWG